VSVYIYIYIERERESVAAASFSALLVSFKFSRPCCLEISFAVLSLNRCDFSTSQLWLIYIECHLHLFI